VRTALWLLFGAVGVVLLIACANISNLLLVRSAARAKEMAIRTALGAGKGRLVRQLLTESALLSLAGGLAGIVLAAAVLGVTRGFLIGIVPRADTITLDPAVLGFATASVLLTTMLFSLAPLGRLRSTWSLALAVQDTSRTPRYEPRSRLRTALVVGQIAMMTLLLVSGTLLARSLVSLTRVPLGIDTDRVVTARVTLPRNDYPNGQAAAAMLARLTGSLESQSGIEAAGISTSIPLSGDAYTLMGASPANEPSRILESQ
jgi:predicted lysophospholipase L1 biosynthesis ABC-type transport system permease subunit